MIAWLSEHACLDRPWIALDDQVELYGTVLPNLVIWDGAQGLRRMPPSRQANGVASEV